MVEPKEYWIKKYQECKELKNFEGAINCLEKIKEIDETKNQTDYWFKKGLSFLEIKNFENAIKFFDKDLELNIPNFDTLFNKGIALHFQKKNLEALECFNKAWELKYSDYLKIKSQIQKLKEHKEFEKAVYHSTKLSEIELVPFKFWHEKALVLVELKKYQEALECFEESLKITEEPFVLFDKAKCELFLGNEKNCEELLRKASKLDLNIKSKAQNDPVMVKFLEKI